MTHLLADSFCSQYEAVWNNGMYRNESERCEQEYPNEEFVSSFHVLSRHTLTDERLHKNAKERDSSFCNYKIWTILADSMIGKTRMTVLEYMVYVDLSYSSFTVRLQ